MAAKRRKKRKDLKISHRRTQQISQIDADLKMKDQRTYKIIGKRGFKAPILVTSAYHIKRAVFLFEKQGTEIGGQRTEDRGRKAEKRIGEIGKISIFLIFCQGLQFWKSPQRRLRNIWG